MKEREYNVEIRETLVKTVTVKAESPTWAKYFAERDYKDSKHILGAEHFTGVSFAIPRNRNYER
jgi:hypothetical protein